MRRVAIGFGVALGMCLVLLVAAYGFLQTEAGRDRFAQLLAWYLSRPGEREVSIAHVDGVVPHRIHISGLRIRDRQGQWLSLDSATLEWRPLELLRRRLHVTRADVSGLHITRLSAEGDQGRESTGLRVPALPVGITVEQFSLEDVRLGEAVIGVEAALRAVGEWTATSDGTVQARLSVDRTDGALGHAGFNAIFLPGTEQLSLQLEIDEPEGGMIAHLLSIPGLPRVSVQLEGDGPLTAWHGKLIARAGDLASVDTELVVRRPKMYAVTAHGRADVARLMDDPLRRLLLDEVSYRFEVEFAGSEEITLVRGHLSSRAAFVNFAGRSVRGQTDLETDLTFTPRGLETLNDLLAPASVTGMIVRGTLSGTAMQPEGRLEVTVNDPTIDSVSAQAFRGSFSLRPDRDLGMVDLKVMVVGQGQIEGLRAGASEVLDETIDWNMEGQISMEGQIINLARLNISADFIRAVASGNVSLIDGRGDGSLKLEVDDLTRLTPATDLSPRGNLVIEARLHTRDIAHKWDVTITGELRDFSLGYPTMDALLGHRVALASNLTMVTDGGVRIDSVEISGANAKIEGALSLTPEYRILEGRYTLSLEDLAVLSPELRASVGGRLAVDGTAQGDLTDPRLDGSLSLVGARIHDVTVGSLEGTFTIGSVTAEPRGSLSLRLVSPPFGPADASANFVLTGGSQLRLNGLSINTRETNVVGDIVVPLEGPAIEGTLTGQATSLEAWSQVVGRDMSGAVSFAVHTYADGPRQAADVVIEGRHVQIRVTQAETADLGQMKFSTELTDLRESPRGHFVVQTQDARLGDASISSLLLTGDAVSAAATNLRLRAAGDLRGPFEIDTALAITRHDEALRLTISALEARIMGRSLAVRRAAELSYGSGLFVADEFVLEVDGGRIAGEGRVAKGDLRGSLDLTRVPLSLMNLVWPGLGLSGALDGRARVEGPLDAPSGEFEIRPTDVRVTEGVSDVSPLSGVFKGAWRDGRMKVEGKIADASETSLELWAELPLRLTAPSLGVEIPAAEQVSGHVTWRGRLAPVWEFFDLGEDRFRGYANLALDVRGTVGAPQMSGRLVVTEGEYENLTAGTVVKSIHLEGRMDGDRLVFTRGVATDGASGKVTVSGTVDLDRARNFPMQIALEFRNTLLVRRDEITVSASGRLAFEGTLESALLSGQIETHRVEARVINRLPSEVVELDVVELNRPDAPSRSAAPKRVPEKSFIRLDLTLTMPKRVFIRGRGLDSEWSGDLRVKGSTDAPIVEGVLVPVRGEFWFAGKIFKLGEGSIRFDGTEQIDPAVDLSAQYRVSDFTAVISISGRASQPEITLTSDPSLPQSEIAARILFGKSTGQLSALEAAQLAQALASLSGGSGGGMSIIDFARRTLGVDVFRVSGGAEDSEGPTVTVGKYVGEKVFVGVTQGTKPGTRAATVEVEVTPNLSVKSDVGEDGRNDVGVNWRWDY